MDAPSKTPSKYLIQIEASAEYVAAQSEPDEGRYVFAYRIRIRNAGQAPARLLSRHWIITDADSQQQEVKGDGVVGEKPLIQPGEHYEYSSGCSIPTPLGTMRGSYRMEAEDGTLFDAEIPEFMLSGPRLLH
ncbi:Co2+/Mg2+ efflux protein ApaG [Viridibacterium curvum]|uniref:Protein ApaG n=1 Tax=Viridibacterium curvum TaxID=1101404 RepID=A0ABP9R371_9RHOO